MTELLPEDFLDTPEKRMEYNIRDLVVDTFMRKGFNHLIKAERVIAMFFGDDDDPITLAVRRQKPLVFETFKTEEQLRSWRGYSVELAEKNPLAMIFKLTGENPKWLENQ